jgi:ABC-type glycerol-3-phosphate transport system substrate-binding protein
VTVRGTSRGTIALAAAALVVLSGCGGGTGSPSADGVSADPQSVSVTEHDSGGNTFAVNSGTGSTSSGTAR